MASPSNLLNSGKRPCEDFDSPITIDDPRTQIFNDPVHGFIEFHPLLVKIINTPQFQRLKDIKQLGICYWVFPGASHNRFEHCLGTAYLCGKMIDTLCKLHHGEIDITKEESLCIRIAGLCHDLGHGPFSHFFDGVFIPRAKPDSEWKHEDASCELFDFMIEENPDLNKAFESCGLGDYIDFIKELIHGKDPIKDTVERTCIISKKTVAKWFLYEIVSNKRNGIDCDKFDYFARDCLNVGVNSNFDCRRYFQNVRIILVDNQLQICVREKEVFNLYELFHTRWSLHHRVYKHKTQAVIEHLLAKALLKVDPRLRISDSISHRRSYWKLTDSIIYDILRIEIDDHDVKKAEALLLRYESDDHDVKEAQALLLGNESDDHNVKEAKALLLGNESDDHNVKEAKALLLENESDDHDVKEAQALLLGNESDDHNVKEAKALLLENESDDHNVKEAKALLLENESDDHNVKEAQALLRLRDAQALLWRIQRRELYKFCGQTQQLDPRQKCPSENEIAQQMVELSLIKEELKKIEEDKVFVSIVDIHFGMKDRDPIDSVVFFNKSNQPLTLSRELVSLLLPQKFLERYIRVYAKSRDHTEAVKRCFEAWCRKNEYPVPHMLEGDAINGYFTPAFIEQLKIESQAADSASANASANANANEEDQSMEP